MLEIKFDDAIMERSIDAFCGKMAGYDALISEIDRREREAGK